MTAFLTPREAVAAMVVAGAAFTVRRRDDGLGLSFTYRVAETGDLQECRRILAAAKAKPRQFFEAFKLEVERIAGGRG